jgi:hypothetical protein
VPARDPHGARDLGLARGPCHEVRTADRLAFGLRVQGYPVGVGRVGFQALWRVADDVLAKLARQISAEPLGDGGGGQC